MVPINGRDGVGGKGIASCVWSIKMTIQFRGGKNERVYFKDIYFKKDVMVVGPHYVEFDEMIDVGGFYLCCKRTKPLFFLQFCY